MCLKPYDENELMLVIEEAMRMVEEQGAEEGDGTVLSK